MHTRLLAAAVLSLAVAAADVAADRTFDAKSEPPTSGGIGYLYLSELPVSLSLAFYDVLWRFGFDGYLGTGHYEATHTRELRHHGAAFAVNFRAVDRLYPSLGVSVVLQREDHFAYHLPRFCEEVFHDQPHCHPVLSATVEDELLWGIDAKLSYVLFSWLGLTAGYRMPFNAPGGGSLILGASIIMSPATAGSYPY